MRPEHDGFAVGLAFMQTRLHALGVFVDCGLTGRRTGTWREGALFALAAAEAQGHDVAHERVVLLQALGDQPETTTGHRFAPESSYQLRINGEIRTIRWCR